MLIQLHSEPKAILINFLLGEWRGVGGGLVRLMFSFQDKTDALLSHSSVMRLLMSK